MALFIPQKIINQKVNSIDYEFIEKEHTTYIKVHKSYYNDLGYFRNLFYLNNEFSTNLNDWISYVKELIKSAIGKDKNKFLLNLNKASFFMFNFLFDKSNFNIKAEKILIFSSIIIFPYNMNFIIKISGTDDKVDERLKKEYLSTKKIEELTISSNKISFTVPKVSNYSENLNQFFIEKINAKELHKHHNQNFIIENKILEALIMFYVEIGLKSESLNFSHDLNDFEYLDLLKKLRKGIVNLEYLIPLIQKNKLMYVSFIHNDLGSFNILVDTQNNPYIIDWGISKLGYVAKDLTTLILDYEKANKKICKLLDFSENHYTFYEQMLLSRFITLIEYLFKFKSKNLTNSNSEILKRMINDFNIFSCKIISLSKK